MNEVSSYPDVVNGTCNPLPSWKVALRAEGAMLGSGYGIDGTEPIDVTIPESLADVGGSYAEYLVTPQEDAVLSSGWSYDLVDSIAAYDWYVEGGVLIGSRENVTLTYDDLVAMGQGAMVDHLLTLMVTDGLGNVTLDVGTLTVVPEPASLSLLLVALGSLALLRTRKR